MGEVKGSFRTKLIVFLSIILIIGAGVAVYATFIIPDQCGNYECFQAHMRECKRATFTNSQNEALWGYEITGNEGNMCDVDVRIIQLKESEPGLERLTDYEMTCAYPLGIDVYPEKDLGACHGRLKEELQTIIIKKLHTYVVENLGKLDEGLNSAI